MELGSGGLCTTLLRNQMALESLDGCSSDGICIGFMTKKCLSVSKCCLTIYYCTVHLAGARYTWVPCLAAHNSHYVHFVIAV